MKWGRSALVVGIGAIMCCSLALGNEPQMPLERTFPQPKAAVEKALRTLQSSVSGRLPVLEGFAQPGDRPFGHFQRAFYQCAVQIFSLPSGGSKVIVNAKITAWYSDPTPSRSGYQKLPSNGRLETDLLDQLAEALGISPSEAAPSSSGSKVNTSGTGIAAPMPRLPEGAMRGTPGNASGGNSDSLKSETDAAEKHEQELSTEAKGLEEILQNQTHPTNLAAIKTTGTPVLQSPNAGARILFPATAGDEFEILDMNSNWVHVRISGLSRGWIRRSSLEMPQDTSPKKPAASAPGAPGEFKIGNEQIAPFPGDWEPLRGKIVKIVTVQEATGGAPANPQARLQFAKTLFLKQYSQMSQTDPPAGVVIIFDADDGGMIAAPTLTLKAWQDGSSSQDSGWDQCFFDPPELSRK